MKLTVSVNELLLLLLLLRCVVMTTANCDFGCVTAPPEFPDMTSLFRQTIQLMEKTDYTFEHLRTAAVDFVADSSAASSVPCCVHQVDIAEMNSRLNTSNPVDLTSICEAGVSTTATRQPVVPLTSRHDDTVIVLSTVGSNHSSRPHVTTAASRPTDSTTVDEQRLVTGPTVASNNITAENTTVPPLIDGLREAEESIVLIIAVSIFVGVVLAIIVFVIILFACKRRLRRRRSVAPNQTSSNGHTVTTTQDKCADKSFHEEPRKAGKTNGRMAQKAARQSSTASTAPLYRSDSNTSSNSGSTPKYQRHDSLGPIDEQTAPLDELTFKAPQRQASINSQAWLIPDGADDYVLQLPTIGETTVDDYVPTTLPRRTMKTSKTADPTPLPPPNNTDPPKRRHLGFAGQSQPQQRTVDCNTRGPQLNRAFHADDDYDAVSDASEVDAATAIHQNATNKFRMAMQQAELMEQEDADSSIEWLPPATVSLDDSRSIRAVHDQ